jgi:hypothetical protein
MMLTDELAQIYSQIMNSLKHFKNNSHDMPQIHNLSFISENLEDESGEYNKIDAKIILEIFEVFKETNNKIISELSNENINMRNELRYLHSYVNLIFNKSQDIVIGTNCNSNILYLI